MRDLSCLYIEEIYVFESVHFNVIWNYLSFLNTGILVFVFLFDEFKKLFLS